MTRSTVLRSVSASSSMHSSPRRSHRPVADEVALGIATYLPDLTRRAIHLTGDREQAEDLVHDAVERALRFRDSFESGGYVRAWLLRILQNVFISQRRRAATERRVLEGAGHDPNGWATLEPTRLAPGLSPPVEAALSELPEHLRSVVTLVDLGEQSYKDAARIEDVPVGTIMSRLSRGRARLASRLTEPAAA